MRPLTTRERVILEAMLTDASTTVDDNATVADRERWLERVAATFAGERCGCGTCPSIVLTDADGRSPGIDSATRVVLEAGAADGYLLLFIDDDRPSYLEFAPWADMPVLEFPALEETTLHN